MCSQCGDRDPGRRFAVEGTTDVLCVRCVRDAVRIAWAHEQIRRIHHAAHGHDSPCPICAHDAWLAGQRVLEDLESSVERARLDAELDAVLSKVPWPDSEESRGWPPA